MTSGKVKVKGAPKAIKSLLGGDRAPVTTMHGGPPNMESRNKLKQYGRYNVRSRADQSEPLQNGPKSPTALRQKWALAEQPQSGY